MDKLIVPFEIQADSITDEGTFEGWGVVFNQKINKPRWDTDFDIFKQGAFEETLKKNGYNGTGIAMLWHHDTTEPIGVWLELQEQKKGLRTKGQLALEVQRGKEAHVLMKIKALNGQSIGFNTLESIIDEKKKIRTITKVDLFEISPVTFPADKKAIITSVNSGIKDALTIRELERSLRDAGMSRADALYISSLCRESLGDTGRMSKSGMNAILQNLQNVNTDFKRFYSGFGPIEKQEEKPTEANPFPNEHS